jgi:hypothetical protein
MKTWFVLMFISTPVLACPAGTIDLEGNCAIVDAPPAETAVPVKPSDEKPPKDKMPSYEREGVKALMLPPLTAQDEKQDQEKTDAVAQGKSAAGVP